MLLPSDVARLVLGYLQEEGLSATSQAFIHESPNLKEYAEHSTGDGAIPACVFSVFGKGLTTILTEYVAIKTNETCHEVPAMMTSLWKKLDFTLKQIKAMQNSPATSACQRMRSRVGMANLARQRAVTMGSTTAVVCSSVSEAATIISPALTSHGMLCHSTPVSYAAPQIRSTPSSGSLSHIQDGGRLLNTPRDSPVQIIVSEHRGNPGPMSPGRRKWDTPRKRGGAASGSGGASRSTAAASSVGAEPQPEEVVDENFPQLVIQNARDRILGDRLLQEKLAENINKILANEPVPQTSKAPSSTLEADQSIDEILGLQGEIHMSDDAIHDILEQTESDPAFQALFDLFDYNKSKLPDGEPGDGDISSCPEETDTVLASTSTSTSTTFAPAPSDLGITVQDAAPSEPVPAKRAAQERKTRRLTAPTFIKKTNRSSRIENSSAKLLISHAEHRGVPSTATAASRRKEKSPAFSSSVAETPMDIDDFLNNAPSMPSSTAAMEAPLPVSKAPSSAGLSGSSTVPSSVAPQVDAVSNMDKNKQCTQTQCSKEQAVVGPSLAPVAPSVFLPPPPPPPSQVEATTNLPQRAAPSSVQDAQPVLAHSKAPEPASTFAAPAATVAALPLSAPTATTAAPPPSATTSSTASVTLGLATPMQNIQTSPSSALVTATSECNQSPLGKPTADPSNIVSLKIIISDNQEEDSSGDAALNQAISSISMDKIPTIYLSSPAKSPGGPTLGGPTVASPGLGVPGTPRTNLDEASLAVSGLQSSEVQVNPINAAAVITSPLTGTAAGQQSYIIQLPLDTSSNPGLQAPAASYFVMAEPPATDAESRPVLMPAGVPSGQPLPTSAQFSVTTPTRPTAFAAGPTLILPSPVKPVILPVSVMGQNALGKVQMVSNQLVAIQTPVPIQQSEVVKATSPLDTIKQSTTSIAAKNLVGKRIQPVLPESKQKDPGPSHRRILCFDSSAKVQSPPPKAATTAATAKTSPSPKSSSQSGKERPQSLRTKPAILGGNKPKRRVETIRCPTEPLSGVSLVKETPAPSQKQPKDAKKSSRKQDHKVNSQDSDTISTGGEEPSQPETLKSPDSGKSKSTEKTQKGNEEQRAKGSRGSGSSSSSDPAPKSGSKKSEKSRKEAEDGGSSKSRAEKRTPSQEVPSVTANKENEMKSGAQEQSLPPSSLLSPSSSTSSAASSREVSPPAAAAAAQSGTNSPTKTPKSSKTSSLAKQAAEMLQDIHSFNSPPKAAKKTSGSGTELPAPQNPAAAAAAAAQRQDPPQDCTRTPTRPRRLRDAEGTPKHGLLPPNTPEVPTCSPASETGSENSINMAAHTLMILSRAAIARTGTPLKDSLRQEGVGDKSPAGSKNPKKRKQQPPASASPPAKKEAKESSGKKKERERKKFIDCFPHDLDVDKFLSSLHYDE